MARVQRTLARRSDGSRDGKPSAAVAISEVLPFPQGFLERYKAIFASNTTAAKPVASITLESAEAMAQFDLSSVVHRLAGRRALVVHGDRDDVMPIEDVLRVYACMPQAKEFVEMTGCDHIASTWTAVPPTTGRLRSSSNFSKERYAARDRKHEAARLLRAAPAMVGAAPT